MELDRVSAEILRAVIGNEPEPAPVRTRKDEPGSADHWTPPVLLERGAYLRKLAQAGSGEAGETLKQYPRHCAMLSFRGRNGEVEVHKEFADLFVVLSGSASLVTGGTVVNAREIKPGEIRGDSIEGGKVQELRQHDVIHVPAGTPHQFLVSGEKTVLSLVMKIQESD
jgi:mannose-6-phosphate isomerase-like protein (cupin superfamily)